MLTTRAKGGRAASRSWRIRALFASVLALLLAWSSLSVMPAQAAGDPGLPGIGKAIDNKKDAYDKGDTVTYRLSIKCDSLEEPCGTGTLVDTLDPNLTYTSYVVAHTKNSDGETGTADVSFSQSGQTLTWTIGSAAKPFMDGETLDIVVNAKVKSVPTNADRTIDNNATLTVPGGSKTSPTVTITVNPEAPPVYDWGLIKTKTYPSGDPAVGGTVKYDVRFTRPSSGSAPKNSNGVDIDDFVLTDALPAGAEFVSVTTETGTNGVYNAGPNTITFPGDKIKADGLYCGNPCISYWVAHITVKYPSPAFKNGDEVVNTVSATPDYATDPTTVEPLTAEAKATLKTEKKSLYTSKSASSTNNPAPGETVAWYLQAKNTGNVVLDSAVLTDSLPAHVHDWKVSTPDWWMANQDGSVAKFEYTTDGTNWTALGDLVRNSSTKLSVPAAATEVRMTITNLDIDAYAGFRIEGVVDDDAPAETALKNCMTSDGAAGVTSPSCHTFTVKAKPQVTIYPSKWHAISGGGSHAQPGDEFTWQLNWRTYSNNGGVVDSATVSDVLPAQFELVTETAPCLDYGSPWGAPTETCTASATTPAYSTETVGNDTKITFADMVLPKLPDMTNYQYQLHLRVRVKDGAPATTYTNTMSVSLPEKYDALCNYASTPTTTCSAQDQVTVDTAAAVGLQKWDKGTEPNVAQDTGLANANCPDWNGGYTRYPCVAQSNPGDPFDYLLKLSNQGNVSLTNEVMYDILPYVGDTGVGQTLTNSTRKTEWVPKLTGPITLVGALTTADLGAAAPVVEYNLTTNPCRPELNDGAADGSWQASCDNNWVTSVSDWSTVKSFRIKAFQATGAVWAAGTRLVFQIPMQAPADAAKSEVTASKVDLSIAWNSASQRAFKVNTNNTLSRMLPTEPRKVGIIIPAPLVSVGDYVWYDTDRDGQQDAGELPVKDLLVTLKDADGKVVATTKTDSAGYYSFQNLPEKTAYTITFDRPSGYDFTTRNAGDDTTDSDASSAGVISFTSPTWELGKSHNLGTPGNADDPTLDAGLVEHQDLVSVGDFVWFDTNRDGFQNSGEPPVEGVTVNLLDASGVRLRSTTTNAAGYYYFTNLTPGTNYIIEFIKPDGAVFTTTNITSDTSNQPADTLDSDAPATDGKVPFTSETTGTNSTGPNQADNPGIDAGFISYNLTLAKALTETGPFTPGGTVHFTLTPHNDGPAIALAGWSVVDLLPDGLTATGIAGDGYNCVLATLTCVAAGPLAAKADGKVITVTATIDADFSGTAHNVAYVDKASSDITETNPLEKPTGTTNTADTLTDNDAQADLSVPKVSIGDYVWWDTDRDGLQGTDENPIQGVTVSLVKGGATIATTTTDKDGYYFFADLLPSTDYTVVFGKPDANASFTKQSTDAAATDSNPDPTNGEAPVTTPVKGDNATAAGKADDPTIDAGFVEYNLTLAKELATKGPFKPGDTVEFKLTPHNDGPVAALPGWSVVDLLPTGLTATGISGTGYDCKLPTLTCVASGPLGVKADGNVITVTATIDAGFSGSAHNVAYVAPSGDDVPEINQLVVPTTSMDTSKTDTDNDAQADLTVPKVSVGDFVWFDTNRDGLQTALEPVVPGVTVELYLKGVKQASDVTDGTGHYSFTDLLPSTEYTIKFIKPDGTTFTTVNSTLVTSNSPTGDLADSDAAPATGEVTFTTTATGSNSGDADQADNHGLDAGLVKYNLKLAKSLVTSTTVYKGSTVEFTLTPSNDGPVDALAGWSVTDLLPTELTLVTMDGGDDYTCASNVCTAVDGLAAGATGKPIKVTAKVAVNLTGEVKNVAYVAPDSDDATETNPLGDRPTNATDTSASLTDNDAEAPVQVTSLVSIGDYVWFDTNRDGVQNESTPIEGITVRLFEADGSTPAGTAVTTTNASGFYSFGDLIPGTTYVVAFEKPADTSFTGQNTPDDAKDSDADLVTGRVTVVAPASGGNSLTAPDDPTIDAGLVKYNLVLTKALTSKGPFYEGSVVTFELTPSNQGPVDALVGWSVTDIPEKGMTITGLDGGTTYKCEVATATCTSLVVLPAKASGAPVTVTATIDADYVGDLHNVAYVAPVGTDIPETNLLSVPRDALVDTSTTGTDNDDQAKLTVDSLVSVGDYVWWDHDRDGLQSPDEPVVGQMTVNLLDANGTFLKSTTTTSAGYYFFDDLVPGVDYIIEFIKPDGTSFTDQDMSQADVADSDADLVSGRVPFTAAASGTNKTAPNEMDNPTIDAGLVQFNLALYKSLMTSGTVNPGDVIKFSLMPVNEGPSDALGGWSVTDLLPKGLKLVSMSGDGYTCTDNVCFNDAPLAAGALGEPITVKAKVTATKKGELWNVAYVAPSDLDVPETNPLGDLPTSDTDTSLTPTDNDDQDVVDITLPSEHLAYTGAEGSLGILGVGFGLVAIGAVVLAKRRRRA